MNGGSQYDWGGTIGTSTGAYRADVAIRDEVIAAVGRDLSAGRDEIDATGMLVFSGGIDSTNQRYHAIRHPRSSEAEAFNRLFAASALTDQPIMVFHVSTADGVTAVRDARGAGLMVSAETCPQYLFLTRRDAGQAGHGGGQVDVLSTPARSPRSGGTLALVGDRRHRDRIGSRALSFRRKRQALCWTGLRFQEDRQRAVCNIVWSEEVPVAMVCAFEANPDESLADRLIDALAMEETAGGEFSPLVLAAVLVVDRFSFPYLGLRVDDARDPVGTLRPMWERYEPQADSYVDRATAPEHAMPANAVPPATAGPR